MNKKVIIFWIENGMFKKKEVDYSSEISLETILIQEEDVCIETLKKYPEQLRYVNKKTKEMCEIAVARNGLVLDYVPYEFIDEDLCMLAICQNIHALQYIPEKYLDDTDSKIVQLWNDFW